MRRKVVVSVLRRPISGLYIRALLFLLMIIFSVFSFGIFLDRTYSAVNDALESEGIF